MLRTMLMLTLLTVATITHVAYNTNAESAPNLQFFFGRDETVQHPHKEFDNFISIWYL